MLLHMYWADAVFIHQAAALSVWNDVLATSLKVWHQIENLTLSIEEQCCQISSWSDLKRRSLARLFWKGHPNKQNKESSDMRSVPNQKSNKQVLTSTEKGQIRRCRSCAVHERVSCEATFQQQDCYVTHRQLLVMSNDRHHVLHLTSTQDILCRQSTVEAIFIWPN